MRDRVVRAAEAALEDHGYVSAIDVLTGIRWLEYSWLQSWKQGRTAVLQEGLQTPPRRVAEAMALFQEWAASRGLVPIEAMYVTKTPARSPLRFTVSGDAAVERAYRTHWRSPDVSEKQRAKLEKKANTPPELVAIVSREDWKCHRCRGAGDMLVMEPPAPSCLSCAGLGDLEYLPAGDARVTRSAKAASTKFAAVVKFSRTRKRYERQGYLVEPGALRAARELP